MPHYRSSFELDGEFNRLKEKVGSVHIRVSQINSETLAITKRELDTLKEHADRLKEYLDYLSWKTQRNFAIPNEATQSREEKAE